MPVTIQVQAYGFQPNGVFVDRTLLGNSVSFAGTESHEDVYPSNTGLFWAHLFDFAHFAELCCLHETVWFLHENRRHGVHEHPNAMLDSPVLSDLRSSHALAGFSFLTIDDIQKTRVFHRWRRTLLPIWNQRKMQAPAEFPVLKEILVGCMAEELIGAPYYPTLSSAAIYSPMSGIALDVQTYSLMLHAYGKIRATDASIRETRALLSGVRDVGVPPILALILSRSSSPSDLMQCVCALRDEFAPLRKRMTHLSELARSDTTNRKWLREALRIQREIDGLVARFSSGSRRFELSGLSGDSFGDAGIDLRGRTVEASLDMKSLVRLGADVLLGALRRRIIRPLPHLTRELATIRSHADEIQRVFGRKLTSADLDAAKKAGDSYHALVAHATKSPFSHVRSDSTDLPDRRRFREGIEAIMCSESFDLQCLLDEFAVSIRMARGELDLSDAYVELGNIALRNDHDATAVTMFKRGLDSKDPTGAAAFGLAVAEQRLSRGMEFRLPEGLRLPVTYRQPLTLNDFACDLLKAGQLKKAYRLFKEAVALDDTLFPTYMNLAQLAAKLGYRAKADRYVRRANRLAPDSPEPYFLMGVSSKERGQERKALDWLGKALQRAESDHRILTIIGHVHFCLKAFADARDYLRKSLALRAKAAAVDENDAIMTSYVWDEYDIRMLLALSLYLTKEYAEACSLFSGLADEKPDNASTFLHWGYALYELGEHEDAADRFLRAFQLDHALLDALDHALRLYGDMGWHDRILEILSNESLNALPRERVLFLRALAHMEIGRPDEAVCEIEAAIAAGYADSAALYSFACASDRASCWNAAVMAYQRVVVLDPYNHCAWANLAAAFMELRQAEQALAAATRAYNLAPQDKTNLGILAAAQERCGDITSAVRTLERLVEISAAQDELWPQHTKELEELRKQLAAGSGRER